MHVLISIVLQNATRPITKAVFSRFRAECRRAAFLIMVGAPFDALLGDGKAIGRIGEARGHLNNREPRGREQKNDVPKMPKSQLNVAKGSDRSASMPTPSQSRSAGKRRSGWGRRGRRGARSEQREGSRPASSDVQTLALAA